jgi:hypothetical protein
MASLVRDDLSKCLVMLATKHHFPPVVLQNILGLFVSLYTSFGPVLKVLIECFFVHVFLKALHQLNGLLSKQVCSSSNEQCVLCAIEGRPSNGVCVLHAG